MLPQEFQTSINLKDESQCQILQCSCPFVEVSSSQDIFCIDRKSKSLKTETDSLTEFVLPTYTETRLDKSNLPKFTGNSFLSTFRVTQVYLLVINCDVTIKNEVSKVLKLIQILPTAEKLIVFQLVRRIREGCSIKIVPYSDSEMNSLIIDTRMYLKRKLDWRKFIIGEFHSHILKKTPTKYFPTFDEIAYYKRSLLIDHYFEDYLKTATKNQIDKLYREVFQWNNATKLRCASYKKQKFASISYLDSIFKKST